MPRKHLFTLVVMLATAGVAGLFAFTRTVELGQGAEGSTKPDNAIAFRLDELDRFEASLRQQLRDAQDGATIPPPATVYRRADAAAAGDREAAEQEEHADEHDGEHADDGDHEDDDEGRGGDDRDD
jgi:hypothetical protein